MSKVKATTSWYYSTVIVHCTVPYQYITDLATATQYEQTEREWSWASPWAGGVWRLFGPAHSPGAGFWSNGVRKRP